MVTPSPSANSEANPFCDGAAWVSHEDGGKIVPIAQAAIPMTDWGFLRSDATYDVVTVWDGAFFRLQDHLARFRHSCERFRLNPGLTDEQITSILAECVRASGLRSSYVEMICTRGQPPWGSRDPREAVNRFWAFAVPFVWLADDKRRTEGMNLLVSDVQRIPPASVDPTAKNYHWNDLTMGLLDALDRGADSVLLTDGNGNVVEGPGFNIFAWNGECLVTPAEGVLHGITRKTILELAHRRKIRCETRVLPVAELQAAREVFISTSGGGPLPVASVNGQTMAEQCPGPLTRALSQGYWALHQESGYSTTIDYS
ncbi:MAG: aminotransferase class IV [Burkholderiaceae bacterium]